MQVLIRKILLPRGSSSLLRQHAAGEIEILANIFPKSRAKGTEGESLVFPYVSPSPNPRTSKGLRCYSHFIYRSCDCAVDIDSFLKGWISWTEAKLV